MSTPEQLLILDHLSRKRFYYTIAFVLHLGSMTACWWNPAVMLISMFGIFWLGSHFSIGENRDLRTLLALPITAKTLDRSWRLVAFTLPLLASVAIFAISVAIAAWFGAPWLTPFSFISVAIRQTAFLATCLFLASSAHMRRRAFYGPDFGLVLLWMLVLVLPILLLTHEFPQKWSDADASYLVVLAALATSAMAIWNRTDGEKTIMMLIQPEGGPRRRAPSRPTHMTHAGGFGGLPYLVLRAARVPLAITVTISFFSGLMMGILGLGASTPPAGLINFSVVTIWFITAESVLTQLRVLRTVALGRAALTHLLVLWPLGLTAIHLTAIGTVARVFFGASVWTGIHWFVAFAFAVLSGLMVPLFLRFSALHRIISAIFIPTTFLSLLLNEPTLKIPGPAIAIGIGLAVVTFEWVTCYYLLGSPHPWRSGAMNSSGKNRQLG